MSRNMRIQQDEKASLIQNEIQPSPYDPSWDAGPAFSQKRKGTCVNLGTNIGASVAVFGMIASWIASAEVVQNIQTDYNKPFAICFITRLGWGMCLIGWLVWRTFYRRGPKEMALHPEGYFTWKYYVPLAIGMSMIGFASGYTWYLSLAHTAVAGNTALYQTAPVLVFLFSICLLKEKVTPFKVAATFFCVAGTLVVSLTKHAGSSPNNNNSNHSNHSNHSDHSNHPHSWLLRSPLADDGSLYGPLDGSSDATDADDVFGPLSNVVGTFASQAFQEAFPSSAATPLHAQSSVFNRVVPGHPAGAAAYAYLDGSSSSSSTGGAGGEDPDAPITRQGFGYAMCFLSTALYAIFEVLYKRFATHVEDPFPVANSQRFLGLIGCSVVVLAWVFPVLNATGVEEFEWPTGDTAKMLGVNVALDLVFNVSFLIAILLTSPLFVSLATIGTIPVSIITDHLMGKPPLPHIAYLGVGSIVIGFTCLGIDTKRNGSNH